MASNVTDPLDEQRKCLCRLESKLLETATAYQQNYYEICSDWNRYESQELNYLRDYIGYAICGPPKFEDNNPENDENNEDSSDRRNSENRHFVYNEKQQKSINLIYDKVIEYGKCKETCCAVLCGIIYNVTFNKDEALKAEEKRILEFKAAAESRERRNNVPSIEAENMDNAGPEIHICPWPVFKVRRCSDEKTKIKKDSVDKENLEKIYFIDIGGRVYEGFNDYLEKNTLPKCTMVLPKNGKYQIDPEFCTNAILDKENLDDIVTTVWLEIHESPANNIASQVVEVGDTVSTVVTVASIGVGLAAMVTPIGPGIALASLVGGGVSGLWTVGRSTHQLVDRSNHGESINVTDKAALSAWIGIAGGTMGIAATGSSVLLSRAIRTGTTVGKGATLAYDAVQVGSLFVNGVGIGFKSYDTYVNYMETGNISLQDLFLLTTHVFFFYNSVVNIRLARNIIETSQGQLLKDYEASLRSNRHRKEFERIARNTRAAGTNDVSSNEEIIRGINKIANKDEFFQAMVRNRKSLSASNARAAFRDGKVTINSVLTIDPIEFANLPKDVRVDIVKGVSSVTMENSAGIKPNNSAGIKSNISPGIKTNKNVETKPNTAAMKPNDSAGIKPNDSTGIKPNDSTGIKPNDSTGTKPKTSTGTTQNNSPVIKPTVSTETTQNDSTGMKPNKSTGIKSPNDSTGIKQNNSAETKLKTSTGTTQNDSPVFNTKEPTVIKPETRTNETSFKNFTANNGTILKEFCIKHSNAMLQVAPPKIADFANVLNDLSSVQNPAVIFVKLLEIGYKILQEMPRDELIAFGSIVAIVVQFLWDYVKSNMRTMKPGKMIDDPSSGEMLDRLVQELWLRVENKIDVWVNAFKQWLKKNYRQSINEPIVNNRQSINDPLVNNRQFQSNR